MTFLIELKDLVQKVRINKFLSLPTRSFLDMLMKATKSSIAVTVSITLCSNNESSFSGDFPTTWGTKASGNSKSTDAFFNNEETRLGPADETLKAIQFQDNHPIDENSKSTVLSSTTSTTSISQGGTRTETPIAYSLRSASLISNFLSISDIVGQCEVIMHQGVCDKDEAISALFVPMGPTKALLLLDVTNLSKKQSLFKKVNSMEIVAVQTADDGMDNPFTKLLEEFCGTLREEDLYRKIETYKSNGSKTTQRNVHLTNTSSSISVSVDSCNSSTADCRFQVLNEFATKSTMKSPIPLREYDSKPSSINRESSLKVTSKSSIKPQSRGVRMQQKMKSFGDSLSRTKLTSQPLLISKKETRFPFSVLPPPELSLMEDDITLKQSAPAVSEAIVDLPTACTISNCAELVVSCAKPSDFPPETLTPHTTEEYTAVIDRSGYTTSPAESSASSLNLSLDIPTAEGFFSISSNFTLIFSIVTIYFLLCAVVTAIDSAVESVAPRKSPIVGLPIRNRVDKRKDDTQSDINSDVRVLRRSPRTRLIATGDESNVDLISNSAPPLESSVSKKTTPEAVVIASADRYCLREVSTSSSGGRTPSFETFSFAQTPLSIPINYYTSASGFTPNDNIRSAVLDSAYLDLIVSPDDAVPVLREDSCSLVGVDIVRNPSECTRSSPLENSYGTNDGVSLFQSVVGAGSTRSSTSLSRPQPHPNNGESIRQANISEMQTLIEPTYSQMDVDNNSEIVTDVHSGQPDCHEQDTQLNEKLAQAHQGFSNLHELPQSMKSLLNRCLLCRKISPMDCAKQLFQAIEQCIPDDVPTTVTTSRIQQTSSKSRQKSSKSAQSCFRATCQIRLWKALITALQEVVRKKIGSVAEKIEFFCGCSVLLIVLEIENSNRLISMSWNASTVDRDGESRRNDDQLTLSLKRSFELYANRLSAALSSNFLVEDGQQRLSLSWLINDCGTGIINGGERGRLPIGPVSMRSVMDLLYSEYNSSSVWNHITGILEEFIDEIDPNMSPEKANTISTAMEIDTSSISIACAAAVIQENSHCSHSTSVLDDVLPEPDTILTASRPSGAIDPSRSSLSSKGKIVVDRKSKSGLIGHRISMGQKKRVTIDPSYAVNLERRNTERMQTQLKRALTNSGFTPSPVAVAGQDTVDIVPSTQFSTMDGVVEPNRAGQRQRTQIIQETPCEHQGRLHEKRNLKRHRSESDAISRRSRFDINPGWAASPSPSPTLMPFSGEMPYQAYDYSASPAVMAKEEKICFDLSASAISGAQHSAETFLGIGDGSFLKTSTASSENMVVTSAGGMRRPARRKTAAGDSAGVLLFHDES